MILPVYGFFAGGMHSARLFPRVVPRPPPGDGQRRLLQRRSADRRALLWLSASLKEDMDLRLAVTTLAALYMVGAMLLLFLPETKGKPLPE